MLFHVGKYKRNNNFFANSLQIGNSINGFCDIGIGICDMAVESSVV
jgi:hypothetical protein